MERSEERPAGALMSKSERSTTEGGAGMRLVLAVALLLTVLMAGMAPAQAPPGALRLKVLEISRALPLEGTRAESLVLALELRGPARQALRRIQPRREEFTLLAGKERLPCRSLRGGSVPEDPNVLHFRLGFALPAPPIREVALEACLPRPEEPVQMMLRLTDLRPGMSPVEQTGATWKVQIQHCRLGPYDPPSVPPSGAFLTKGGPADVRIFRKAGEGKPDPEQALQVRLFSRTLTLYDATLDLDGSLVQAGRPPSPLLAARLVRHPSGAAETRVFAAFLTAECSFAAPSPVRPFDVVLRFLQRPARSQPEVVTIPGLPVPGR